MLARKPATHHAGGRGGRPESEDGGTVTFSPFRHPKRTRHSGTQEQSVNGSREAATMKSVRVVCGTKNGSTQQVAGSKVVPGLVELEVAVPHLRLAEW